MKSLIKDLLATAKVRGSFGLDGFVKVESFSGEYEHFLNLDKVFVEFNGSPLRGAILRDDWYIIEDVKLRHSDILLKLKGIDQAEIAKSFAGACLYIPRSKAPILNKGEFYAGDLCNCVLVCEDTVVGKITSIVEGGSSYLIELSEAETGRQILIPFNSEFIGKIDLKAKTVQLMHRWILE